MPVLAAPITSVDELSGVSFETFLLNFAMYIKGEGEYGRPLDQAAVVMHVRSRGVTISDMVSHYGTRPETTGYFLEYDYNLDGEVHPINIVGPALTTNKNACLQSNSEVEVTAANQDAAHKQIAMKWKRVADYVERTTWNEARRGFIFDDVQKGGTALVEVFPKEVDKQQTSQISEGKGGLAVYQCDCGAAGMTQVSIDDGEDNETPSSIECPECGQEARAAITSIEGLQLGEGEVPVYDIESAVIPCFNFTIDAYGAKIGGIQTATFLQIQRLRDSMWMQTNYPSMSLGATSNWGYSLQADYALARGRWDYLNSTPVGSMWGHERYAVREIYLHEDSYESYRSPDDYEFVNKDGVTTFEIKKGQTIGEAQIAMCGENFHGFKFVWNEERLLDIPTPKKEEVNFRYRFSDIHWSRESGSYRSSPNYSIVYIQDDITLLNTLNHNIITRNAVNPVFYDSLTFEQSDFQRDFIPTKNNAFEPDFDIRKSVTALPIPTPSPYLSQQMQWLWTIKDSVTMVTPALRGETQKNTPYAAQRQQLEQSYGNLTSVLKSFAQCKCNTFLNKARLIKRFWTLEQFQEIGSSFGELWTEEDVAEMCDIDFERDLIVSYREGSEMPSTPMSKEMKFFGALGQLMPFIQLNPNLIGTDKMTQILQKIDEIGEFDFDLTGLEVNEVVSQKRYNDLSVACQQYAQITYQQIDAMKQQVMSQQPPAPEALAQAQQLAQSGDPDAMKQAQQLAQPTPITAYDLLTEEILTQSGIRFNPNENLDTQKTFFIEMINVELGKTTENAILIEMLTLIVGLIDQAVQEKQSAAVENSPEVQMQREQLAASKESEQNDMQLEGAKLQTASMMQEKDLAAKADMQQADIAKDLLIHSANQEQSDEHKGIDMAAQQEAAETKAKENTTEKA